MTELSKEMQCAVSILLLISWGAYKAWRRYKHDEIIILGWADLFLIGPSLWMVWSEFYFWFVHNV